MQGNILQGYLAQLPWQAILPSSANALTTVTSPDNITRQGNRAARVTLQNITLRVTCSSPVKILNCLLNINEL